MNETSGKQVFETRGGLADSEFQVCWERRGEVRGGRREEGEGVCRPTASTNQDSFFVGVTLSDVGIIVLVRGLGLLIVDSAPRKQLDQCHPSSPLRPPQRSSCCGVQFTPVRSSAKERSHASTRSIAPRTRVIMEKACVAAFVDLWVVERRHASKTCYPGE